LKDIEETILALAESVAEPMELQILELRFVPHVHRPEVRIVLDREVSPVTVADCAGFSRRLSRLLDVEDPVEGAYSLEVSSPGFKRLIRVPRDVPRFVNHRVKIRTHEDVHDRRVWIGVLMNSTDPLVIQTDEMGEIAIPFDAIKQVNLHE